MQQRKNKMHEGLNLLNLIKVYYDQVKLKSYFS